MLEANVALEQGQTQAHVLKTEGVRCVFGGVVAVNGASVEVKRGVVTGLIGPNGAGKTTLLNAIAGEVKVRAGRIMLEGEDISRLSRHERARRGLLRTFQESSEFRRLTVVENVLVGARLGHRESMLGALLGPWYWREAERSALLRALQLLEMFGLRGKIDDLAGNLSGGERRLVELARALMSRPRLLLLDEPLAGVHPRMIGRIVSSLADLRREGVSMLVSLHEPKMIEQLCDEVIVMVQGTVLGTGDYAEVVKLPTVRDAYLGR